MFSINTYKEKLQVIFSSSQLCYVYNTQHLDIKVQDG